MRSFSVVAALLFVLVVGDTEANAQSDFNGPPINYESTSVHDSVAQLNSAIESGDRSLEWNSRNGWLTSLLEELSVPTSSQTLVFSKTSLQISRISPQRPRALYFNDDVYVGYVQGGDVLEVAAVDAQQGAIFYTLKQDEGEPVIRRDQGHCSVCHASSRTQNVPGFVVRSTFPGRDGTPLYSLGTTNTDHRTPLRDRFGGWYVTGTHGSMRHNGNAIASEDASPPIDRDAGANCTNLQSFIDVNAYPASGSDIVALMVLEHQSQMHNAITKANYEARRAAHQDAVMNQLLDREKGFVSESRVRRIASVGENLLRYLLFVDEFQLTDEIVGDQQFRDDFISRGKTDSRGRSLREFDLQTRMFKYPCSYLIHSESFRRLPRPVRDYVEDRLVSVLSGEDTSGDFGHLDVESRRAISGILADTLASFRHRLASRRLE